MNPLHSVFSQGQTPYDVADSEVLKLLEELERKQASVCNSQNKLLNKQIFMLNNTYNIMLLSVSWCATFIGFAYMQSISYIKLRVIIWNSLLISFHIIKRIFFSYNKLLEEEWTSRGRMVQIQDNYYWKLDKLFV